MIRLFRLSDFLLSLLKIRQNLLHVILLVKPLALTVTRNFTNKELF